MISTSEMTQTEPEKREIIFQPNPGPQEQFLAADEQEVLYGGPLEISTLVKTSKGLEEIGDISIGDYVYTPNGSLTKVIEIPFEGEEESYKISFSNGAEVIASHGHKWKVGTSDWAKTQKEFRTRRTFELLNDYKLSRGRNRYYIPKVAPLYYKETPHLISPYIMGVLLSDGCIIKAITIFNEDLEVINRVVDELHEDYELSQDSRIAFRIVKKNREKGSKSLYKEELRRLKIFGKNAFQKSIPVQYLFDSVENRLSLLRGLMDCDGTVRGSEKNRGREAKYSTVSVALKNTFIQLAESLGFRTTYYSEELPNGNLIYRILINGELNPFYLKRKKHKYENCKTRLVNTYITNIEPVGVKKVKCITIEDPDHVFVLDRNIVTHNSAGGGKVVWSYQSVLTPSGWKNCRELQVGDTICDPEGGTQTITHLFAWEELPVWEVEFDDGTVFDTAEEHLWEYRIARDGKGHTRVASTKEMKNHMVRRNQKAIIRNTKAVDFIPKPTEVDPYFLGCILGDGCITTSQFTYSTSEEDWGHYKKEWGFNPKEVKQEKQTVRFVGKTRKYLWDALKGYGLDSTNSFTKFVPESYLFNTKEVRLGVLQGLMDTDGYRDPQRARAEFCSVSPKLKDAVVFLARSLGYRVSVYEKQGSYLNGTGGRVDCQKAYRVYITGENVDNIFRLERKKSGVIGRQVGRRVVEVRETGRKAIGRCITVSAKHNLYVTDDFVVTHNSFALLADALRDLGHPDFRGLILRRTTEELRELIQKSQELYPKVYPDIRWSERRSEWYFPKRPGGRLWMSYLDRDQDVTRYQGQAFNYIAFDELTQWPTPYPWDYMRSRLRTTSSSGLKLYMRCTANPGGLGGSWVKKTFIDPAPWGEAFNARDLETGKELIFPSTHSKAGQPLFQRRFIPAKLKDNPYLYEDGMYEANLLSLPEAERKRLLEGNWDVAEGVAFPEWNRSVHVIPPFDIPDDWRKFRSCDYGYGSYSAVLWFAVDNRDQLIVYRELYVSKVLAVDLADMVLDLERNDGQIAYGVLDSSCWANRGDSGPSIAEQMIRQGCKWRPSDRSKGSRVAGKNEIHRRLQVDEFLGEPRLVFFNNCVKCIDQIPGLPLDPDNPEDVYTKGEDHIYDALRYGCMTRPRSKIWDWNDNSGRSYTPVDPVFGW